MTDEEFTDAWERGETFPRGVSHVERLRIAWVLHRRHGRLEARNRLLEGTERSCAAHGCPEKFDADLTRRWADAIADRLDAEPPASSAGAFLASHPELCRSG